MNADRYRKAGEIYHEALELPPDRRDPFLEHACAGDLDLLSDVESLLAAHADARQFIETPHEQIPSLRSMLALASNEPGSLRPGLAAGQDESDAGDTGVGPLATDLGASPLAPGARLGRYEVIDLLGKGGMGRVYRALDPSLGREVAIKALAPTFRGDPASLRRFEREARVLATMSHPNIATIFGFEQLDDAPYLILERVDGETLAARLSRKALPLEEAVSLADQIVAGLEEAHSKGVIHRDLKPSNVMVTADGRVKLVDFGLAKSLSRPAADLLAESITSPGVVLGTARYMSPEQVRGENVDTRTDVWAFGCVLYEMLTAQPAFAGDSVSDVVAAVLRDDPAWQELPSTTPPSVHRLLRRCLNRDARMRLQHIGDARLELVERDDTGTTESNSRTRRLDGQPKRSRAAAAALLAAAATIGAVALWQWPRTEAPARMARVSLELPTRVTLDRGFAAPFAITPAGSHVVFEATEGTTQQLYVRELSEPALRALPGTEGARQPFLSPDGTWVGFFANRKLAKVPLGGGAVVPLADIGGNPRGATWAGDGTIIVAPTQTSGLMRLPDSGGRLTPLTTIDKVRGESTHRWPDVLPGGKWILFTVGMEDASFDEARIEAVSMETGERRPIVSGAGFARYVPDGRLVFVRGGLLHTVAFDPVQLQVRGVPQALADAVRYDWRNGGSHLAVSASGTLLYTLGEPNSSEFHLAWVDREGRLTRATDTPRPFRDIRISPDGRRVAAVVGTSNESDLWVVDVNGRPSRVSFAMSPHRPVWTRSGTGITIGVQKGERWQLLTVGTEGAVDPTVLYESPNRLYPNAWSPDEKYLMFQELGPDTGWDVRVLEVDLAGRPVGPARAFADTPFHETTAEISPDGRWVSYESDELDGVVHAYVRSFPSGAHKVRASPAGARWPVWDALGRLHFWQTEDSTLQVVDTVETDGQLVPGSPRPVWANGFEPGPSRRVVITVAGARYDIDPQGTRFIVLERETVPAPPELLHPVMVLGWARGARNE